MTSYLNNPTGGIYGQPVQDNYNEVLSRQNYHGMATLSHGSNSITFRTNPNSIMWSYKLNTAVENTYGGRVVQILSTAMEDLRVVIECGMGGWDYAMQIAQFMRNMMVDQRNGQPGLFSYTTRQWHMNVFATSIPFQDQVTATTREIELNFRIQEDISGMITQQTVSAEFAKIQEGIGFSHNQFNTGVGSPGDGTTPPTWINPQSIEKTLTTASVPSTDPFAAQLGKVFSTAKSIPVIGNSI